MPRLTQSKIHSDFSSASETWSEYRAQVIAFYDNYPHSELNDHITREFNKKIRDLNQSESLYISPYNAGLRYIGDGVFTVDPLSFNPYFYIDAASSMLGVLESPSLDLNPAVPSTLDIITATRAGTATYTDASGNIQTAAANTVRVDHVQGEELTPTKYQNIGYTDFSSGWGNYNSSDASGDGYNGQPSRVVTADGNAAKYYISVSSVNAVVYTLSFYIRRISGSGTISGYHGSASNGNQTDITVTSEWTRQQVTFTGDGGNISAGVRVVTSGDQVEISQPQVEEGTTVSDFVANTTGSPKYFAAATYGPRVPMILVEPAATNLISYTDFSSGWVQGGLTISDGGGLSGEVSKVVENDDAGSGNTFYFNVPTVEGQTYTGGFWIRRISGSGSVALHHTFSPTGSQTSITNDVTPEWTFVSAQFLGRTGGGSVRFGVRVYYTSGDSVEIAMPQVEQGTVATSYIPTSGSAVTREKDLLIIDGSDFTDFYNQSEGTFYQEVSTKIITDTNWYLTVSDNTNNNSLVFTRSAGTHRVAIPTQTEKSFSTAVIGQIHRLAMSHDSSASEFRASVDGVNSSPNPITGVTIPTNLTKLNIGSRYNGQTMMGHIKRVIFWPHYSDNI